MGQREFVVDTKQLDILSEQLSVFPSEMNAAIRSSLQTGIHFSLKKIVTKYYALNPKKINGTFRVRTTHDGGPEYASIRYEVIGRRLTPVHFNVSPLVFRTPRPLIEIIRGHILPTSRRMGADGKQKTPIVLPTNAKHMDKETLNVFRGTGEYHTKPRKYFDAAKGKTVFRSPSENLISYRTVSVPQMLGHKMVAREVQEELLYGFDKVLFKRIEQKTGVMQQNITKG